MYHLRLHVNSPDFALHTTTAPVIIVKMQNSAVANTRSIKSFETVNLLLVVCIDCLIDCLIEGLSD